MSDLMATVDGYLALRHALGAKMHGARLYLSSLVNFMNSRAASFITTPLAVEWATLPSDVSSAYHALRFRCVRQFASYMHAADPRHEIPPSWLVPGRSRRATPYLFSTTELESLLGAARALASPLGLLGATHATVLGILAATGMRVGEVTSLQDADVNYTEGTLTIRKTKFGKSRLVPLHQTTIDAIGNYIRRRDTLIRPRRSEALFLSERGSGLKNCGVRRMFSKLVKRIGIATSPNGRLPRLHDLRHRFAIETLLGWYRRNVDAERRLPDLATYLGHAHTAETYWYLRAVPELLSLAARRLETSAEATR